MGPILAGLFPRPDRLCGPIRHRTHPCRPAVPSAVANETTTPADYPDPFAGLIDKGPTPWGTRLWSAPDAPPFELFLDAVPLPLVPDVPSAAAPPPTTSRPRAEVLDRQARLNLEGDPLR